MGDIWTKIKHNPYDLIIDQPIPLRIVDAMNLKEIPEYPLYFASDCGRIYSCKGGKNMKELMQSENETGYMRVAIRINGGSKWKRVHRLVAIAWIAKPKDRDYINHIDCNKRNNAINNLEWVTSGENARSFIKTGKKRHNATNGFSTPVWRQAKNGGEKIYSISISEACREINKEARRGAPHVHAVLKGKYPTAYGFFWGYTEK